MEYLTLENGMISIPFEKTDGRLTFKDAVIMLPNDFARLTSDDIEAIMQQRFDNWLAIINAPPVEEPAEIMPIDPDATV